MYTETVSSLSTAELGSCLRDSLGSGLMINLQYCHLKNYKTWKKITIWEVFLKCACLAVFNAPTKLQLHWPDHILYHASHLMPSSMSSRPWPHPPFVACVNLYLVVSFHTPSISFQHCWGHFPATSQSISCCQDSPISCLHPSCLPPALILGSLF